MDYRLTKPIKNQEGQAVLEYVLVLIVVVAIAQVLFQMNTQFRDWAKDSYVTYFECLLETGEMPSIGGEGAEGLCNDEFAEFSLANGRPPLLPTDTTGGGGGGGTGGGSGGSTDGGSAGGSAGDPPVGNQQVAGDGGGQTRGEETSAAGGTTRGANTTNKFETSDGSGEGGTGTNRKKGKGGETGDTSVTEMSTRNTSGGVTYGEDARGLTSKRFVNEEEEEATRGITSVREKGKRVQNKKLMIVNKIEQKAEEIEDEGFSIGDWIRYLIIAGIIIALVMLIGGQILQISKGLEAE